MLKTNKFTELKKNLNSLVKQRKVLYEILDSTKKSINELENKHDKFIIDLILSEPFVWDISINDTILGTEYVAKCLTKIDGYLNKILDNGVFFYDEEIRLDFSNDLLQMHFSNSEVLEKFIMANKLKISFEEEKERLNKSSKTINEKLEFINKFDGK